MPCGDAFVPRQRAYDCSCRCAAQPASNATLLLLLQVKWICHTTAACKHRRISAEIIMRS